jgi:hypothetical protein
MHGSTVGPSPRGSYIHTYSFLPSIPTTASGKDSENLAAVQLMRPTCRELENLAPSNICVCSTPKREGGRSGPEAGRSAVRTVRACGSDGPRVRRTY